MKSTPLIRAGFALLIWCVAQSSVRAQQTLYAAEGQRNGDAQLYVLESTTGAVIQDIGSLVDQNGNHVCLTGLRFQPGTGVLYALTSNSSPKHRNSLVTVDTNTAVVTVIGSLQDHLCDLAFDPASGALYGTTDDGFLCTIDTTTGQATEIGENGAPDSDGHGFAISAFGKYFTTPDLGSGELWAYDSATGAASAVVPLTSPSIDGVIDALAFDSANSLFGIGYNDGDGSFDLIAINPVNGQITDLGSTGISDLDALAFSPPASAAAPVVLAFLAGNVTGTSAAVSGLVNPNGSDTAVFIEWGTTPGFGNTNELAGVPAGLAARNVNAELTGLTPGTKYYFTIAATNDGGSAPGAVFYFTTPPSAAPGFSQLLYSAAAIAGMDGADELYVVNPANGQVVLDVGALVDVGGNPYKLSSLRFQPMTGTLYGDGFTGTGLPSLMTIDPATAVVTPGATLDNSITDMAFDATSGQLFATDGSGNLATIDLTTGHVAEINASGLASNGGGGLEFDPFGNCFTTPHGDGGGLATYSEATGAGKVIANLSGSPFGNGKIRNLAFDSSGTLFGLDSNAGLSTFHLISINPVTGQITDLGSSAAGDAIAFAPPASPVVPLVFAFPATFVIDSAATLNGIVNPGGANTAVLIEWGTTTNFGHTNEIANLAAGIAPQNVSLALGGLLPGTVYYFTMVASNSAGTTASGVLRFTTRPPLAAGFNQWLYSIGFEVNPNALFDLVILNPTNGRMVLDVGSLVDAGGGYYQPASLRFQPGTGTLYGVGLNENFHRVLATIDPATAQVTVLGLLGVELYDIAFDPNSGELFGVTPVSQTGNPGLYKIDPATLRETFIGDFQAPDEIVGFAVNSQGLFFTASSHDNGFLATLNPENGAGDVVASLSGSPFSDGSGIHSLAFAANNVLYGIDTSHDSNEIDLINIDTITGRITDLGPTVGDEGLAFSLPLAVPSATTIAAFSVTTNSATILGTANPNGETSTAYILWGTTTNFGNSNLLGGLAAGFTPQNVTGVITGMLPETTYYYTIAATNGIGFGQGNVRQFTTPPAGFQPLLYTIADGELCTLNPTNGRVLADIGPAVDTNGNNHYFSTIRFHPGTGTLYGIADDEFLVTINPATALVTELGTLDNSITDMAFDPATGTLYGTDDTANLCTIDLTTGHVTVLGESSFEANGESGAGMAINALGQNFCTQMDPNAYASTVVGSYNLANGAGTTVASLRGGRAGSQFNVIFNLAFDASDTLYGVNVNLVSDAEELVTINPATGQITVLGSLFQPEGLAFSLPLPIAPFATTVAAGTLESTSATLNGLVNPNGRSTAVSILWGSTPDFGNTNVLACLPAGIAPVSVSTPLTGLTPLTTYYFTVVATNALGSGSGQVLSFTTPIPPIVSVVTVGAVAANSVTLNAPVNSGDGLTTVYFEWGTTTAYGHTNQVTLAGAPGVSIVNHVLNGLLPGVTYHFNVVVVNTAGSTSQTDTTFTTAPLPPITVLNFYHLGDNDATPGAFYAATNTVDSIGGANLTGYSSPAYYPFVQPAATAETGSELCAYLYGGIFSGASLAPVTNNFVLEAWVNPYFPIGNAWAPIVYNGDAEWDGWGLFQYNDQIVARFGNVGWVPGDPAAGAPRVPMMYSTWMHVALVEDNGMATLYTNGVAAGPPVAAFPVRAFYEGFGLGQGNTGNFDSRVLVNFKGAIDDVRLSTFAPGQFYTNDLLASAAGPVLISQSASNLTPTGAELDVVLNPNGAGGTVTFAWGGTTNLGSTNAVTFTGDGTPLTVSNLLTGLSENTPYYCSVTAASGSGTEFSAIMKFTTPVAPLGATTLAASSITANSATLNGMVEMALLPGSAGFAWGTSPSLGNSIELFFFGGGFTGWNLDYTLTGLAPGTTYYYAAVASTSAGTVQGAIQSFTTASPPIVTTIAASAVSTSAATLNGLVNPFGLDSAVFIEWGDTPALGNTNELPGLTAGFAAESVSGDLNGLSPGTTYYFRVVATNSSAPGAGNVWHFTTLPPPSPGFSQWLYSAERGTGIDGSDELVILDPANGRVVLEIGSVTDGYGNYYNLTGLRFQPGTGALYALAFQNHSSWQVLVRIDPATAIATFIGLTSSIFFGPKNFVDIAFDPVSASLYGTAAGNSVYTIDLATALITSVGVTGLPAGPGHGFAISSSRTYYTTPNGDSGVLATIAPANGAGSVVASLNGSPLGNGEIDNLAFAENDILYGIDASSDHSSSHLITLSPNTGQITDLGSVVAGDGLAFCLSLTAPSVITLAASDVTPTAATLDGLVNPNGQSTAVTIRWGTSTNFGNTNALAPLAGFAPQNVSAALVGLSPRTTYYFTVAAVNAAGASCGDIMIFTTPGPPGVDSVTVNSSSFNLAAVNALVNPGGGWTIIYIEWGTTTAYGNTNYAVLAPGFEDEPVSGTLDGLLPGTTYHFAVVATNEFDRASSADFTFTTDPAPLITVRNFYHLGDNDPGAVPGGTIATTIDSLGGNNLAGFNSPLYAPTVSDPAGLETGGQFSAGFNGTNQSLGGPGLGSVGQNFALEAWVNPSGPSTAGSRFQVIAYNGNASTEGWGLLEDPFGNVVVLFGGVAFLFDTPLPVGEWTHLALVNDGGVSELYTNGVEAGAAVTAFHPPTGKFGIGSDPQSPGGEPFAGLIDEVRYFTFAPRGFFPGDLLINKTGPILLAQSAAGVGANGAELDATVNPNGSAGTIVFAWGGTTNLGTTNIIAYDSGTVPLSVSNILTGLSLNTLYYFSVTVTGAPGSESGPIDRFQTPSAPAIVSTAPASEVTGTSATLGGTVNPNGLSTAVTIQWGTTTNLGNTNILASLAAGFTPRNVSTALTGFSPLTTYYFSLTAANAAGASDGGIMTFTTPGPPGVGAVTVSTSTVSLATVNASVNSGGAATTVYFEWGTTTAYGNTNETILAVGFDVQSVGVTLNGLRPDATYHIAVVVSNVVGSASSADFTFTTVPAPPITVRNFYHLGDNDPGALAGGATVTTIDSLGGNSLSGFNSPLYASTVSTGAALETGGALSVGFNGANQSLGGSGLGSESMNFALEAWVNPSGPSTTGSRYQVIAYNGNTSIDGWGLLEDPGGKVVALYGGVAILFGVPLPVGDWTHLALVNDAGVSKLYTNGVLAGSAVASFHTPGGPFGIGSDPQSPGREPFAGLIDEVRFFTFATGGFYPGDLLINKTGPILLAQSAGAVGINGAELDATVNPNGSAGTVVFAWGGTTNLGTTNVIAYDSGTVPLTASNILTGLSPHTPYYYNVTVTGAPGSESGPIERFVTLALPAVVATTPASGITGTSATLNGVVDPNGSATAVSFIWGATTNLGTTNVLAGLAGGSGVQNVSNLLTGLAPGTTYYFAVVASNSRGAVEGAVLSFKTPLTPVANTLSASGISGTAATLNGTIYPQGLAAEVSFVWGLSSSLGTTNPVAGLTSAYGSVSVNSMLTGLRPGTTYYYAVAASNVGGSVEGPVRSFATAAQPVAATVAASGISTTSATLNGTVYPLGSVTTASFVWGVSTNFGSTNVVGALVSAYGSQSMSNTLNGLTPGTTYYYAVAAANAGGVVAGGVLSFTTPSPPVVVTQPDSGLTGTSATLNGTVYPLSLMTTAVGFAWGTSPSLGTTNAVANLTSAYGSQIVSSTLTGLTPGTTYYYAVFASNVRGTAVGAVRSFTTPSVPVVVTLPPGGVTGTSATLNGTVYPLGLPTQAGFVWGASPSLGATNPFVSLASAYGSQNMSNTLTGLTPGTTYYYAVAATNVGGLVDGTVKSFTTPSPPVVVTLAANGVTGTSATLNGTVYPMGSVATASFVWGTSTNLASTNVIGGLASAYGSQNVSNTVAGLTPGTIYYYAAAATNIGGAAGGAVRSFTTAGSTHDLGRAATKMTRSLRVAGLTTVPDGTRRIELMAGAGGSYVVEATCDPITGTWIGISTNTAASDGKITFTDPQSANAPSRFYRLRNP